MYKIVAPLIVCICIASCRPPAYTPKPPGYYKIDTPAAHTYRVFSDSGFPYSFEYPTYAEVRPDSSSYEEKADNPYWINIYIPDLGGIINFTYKEISTKQTLNDLIVRSYDLTAFHHQKSASEESKEFYNGANVFVLTFALGGDAASKFQFIATDSVKHFIRGALYFDVTPNADSLQPAYDFVKRDIEHMLMTLRWKGPNGSVGISPE
jgi:gliding motility-associated lipoprotein GldD